MKTFLAIFVLLVAGCGGGPAWKNFHDARAGFSADFPGDVSQPQGIEKSGTGGPETYHFECRPASGLTYQVTFIAQTNTPQEIAGRLDSVANQKIASDSNFTSVKTSRIDLGDAKGVEQVFLKQSKDFGNSFMRVRTYVTPRGDYTVTVDSVTSADAYAPDVERFFKSFKIDATT
jgi:hypothetical protein